MVARLVNVFLHPYFLGCIIIYSLIRILRAEKIPVPDFVNGQITDLICIPFVLMICLAVVRAIKKDEKLQLKPWLVFLICVEYSIIFEWMLPAKSSIYTSDILDVVMYFIGGFLFLIIQKRMVPKITANEVNMN